MAEVSKMYLPMNSYYENFPGRPVVKQTCDPTNKSCFKLQRIIHQLAISAKDLIIKGLSSFQADVEFKTCLKFEAVVYYISDKS